MDVDVFLSVSDGDSQTVVNVPPQLPLVVHESHVCNHDESPVFTEAVGGV